MILAGIDIGTNTLRLLISDVQENGLRELYSDRRTTRLGQALEKNGALSPDAEDRSLKVLADFREKITNYEADAVYAVGTSALRRATNASAFLVRAREEAGIEIKVVDGDEEARLTLLGVAAALGSLEDSMVIDIGGGSTEMILVRGHEPPRTKSLQIGAVYLTDAFIRHDPPGPDELNALKDSVRVRLGSFDSQIGHRIPGSLIGTAGTITTLAAMDQGLDDYDPERINDYILTRKAIDRMVSRLSRMTLHERRSIKGLEPGREDIILAGAIVVQEIMHRYGYDRMKVSDWGLREGIVLDLYQRLRKCQMA